MRELATPLLNPEAPKRYDGPPVRAKGKQVLVEPLPDAFTTASGLLINTHKLELEPIQRAKVVSVGRDVAGISPGDTVIYKRQWGRELDPKFCGQLFLEQDMIEGVIE